MDAGIIRKIMLNYDKIAEVVGKDDYLSALIYAAETVDLFQQMSEPFKEKILELDPELIQKGLNAILFSCGQLTQEGSIYLRHNDILYKILMMSLNEAEFKDSYPSIHHYLEIIADYSFSEDKDETHYSLKPDPWKIRLLETPIHKNYPILDKVKRIQELFNKAMQSFKDNPYLASVYFLGMLKLNSEYKAAALGLFFTLITMTENCRKLFLDARHSEFLSTAMQLLILIKQLKPNRYHQDITSFIGLSLQVNRQYAEAISIFQEGIEIYPVYTPYHESLADCLYTHGLLAEAKTKYVSNITHFPGSLSSQTRFLMLLLDEVTATGDKTTLVEKLQSEFKADSPAIDNLIIGIQLALIDYFDKKPTDLPEVIDLLKNLIKLDNKFFPSYILLAQIYFELCSLSAESREHFFPEFKNIFEKIYLIDPGASRYIYNSSFESYIKTGHISEEQKLLLSTGNSNCQQLIEYPPVSGALITSTPQNLSSFRHLLWKEFKRSHQGKTPSAGVKATLS